MARTGPQFSRPLSRDSMNAAHLSLSNELKPANIVASLDRSLEVFSLQLSEFWTQNNLKKAAQTSTIPICRPEANATSPGKEAKISNTDDQSGSVNPYPQ